jgi:hypothetical protein
MRTDIKQKGVFVKTTLKTIAVKIKACRMDRTISMMTIAAGVLFLILALSGCHGGHH